jgi:hypothetical protein
MPCLDPKVGWKILKLSLGKASAVLDATTQRAKGKSASAGAAENSMGKPMMST